MSERIDRRIGGSQALLWTLVAILAVAAGAGLFIWLRPGAGGLSRNQPAQAAPQPAKPARPDEPLTVTLYYPVDGMLSGAPAPVRRQPDTQSQAREALTALFSDPRTQQSALFREVGFREFFLDASGTGYVDLTIVPPNGVKASAWEELLALHAVVNTLTQNFEEIRQVRFLIGGKEALTLAGHIDLSRKFEKRMDLVKQ
jgi:germination protein M